jgi:septum site-determining protein MinD
MGRRIVITSGKGGVGKTTLTANLGLMLAGKGSAVALVDADIGLNNLDVALGLENKVVYDLGDVVFGRCRLKQALVRGEAENLWLLPSAKINSERIKAADFAPVIAELEKISDFVLIDCPAGIEAGFHRAVASAREAIVVVTPHIGSVRDADKVVNLLSSYNLESVSLAVNRIRGDLVVKGSTPGAADLSKLLRIRLSGAIPEDDGISINGAVEFGAGERIKKAYKMFAENVANEGGPVYDCERAYKGFFSNLLRRKENYGNER